LAIRSIGVIRGRLFLELIPQRELHHAGCCWAVQAKA
jgi:hypothetical protein